MIETFTALAEPSRLRIVELLKDGPRPVGEIGTRLRLSQPVDWTVSMALNVGFGRVEE